MSAYLQKNLTPFHWAPKATSRRPPQVEMAVCVRGAFTLAPGQPLEAIEDIIDQGFLSGEVWPDDDPDKLGPVLNSSDFADWKPHADLLLSGTCHPARRPDVVCDVSWGVGNWSKTLRVFGARTFKPGVLFGGSVGDPEPFLSVPLTWQNAYGGPGHFNPAGKGFDSPEMPNLELPDQAVSKPGQKKLKPATFLPISSRWPERWSKVGRNYGKKWEKTRAPFVSDDFDWTHFNAAPEDQRLDGYLRGDERVWFRNLHPEHPQFEVTLPGLRLRALVKTADDVVTDMVLNLDTLFAQLDEGRLILNWRGLFPISKLDMSDVTFVLIASESLASDPLPLEHYLAMIEAHEADPIGLQEKMPAGFLEVGAAMEALAVSERDGTPPPDLDAVKAKLPEGSPFLPWFPSAVMVAQDPLGPALGELIESLSGQESPLGSLDLGPIFESLKKAKGPGEAAEAFEEMAGQAPPAMSGAFAKLAQELRTAERAQAAPPPGETEHPADALSRMSGVFSGEIGEKLKHSAGVVKDSFEQVEAKLADLPDGAAALKEALGSPASPPETSPLDVLKGLSGSVAAALGPKTDPKIGEQIQAELAKVPDLDAEVGAALAPLGELELPDLSQLKVDMSAMHVRLDEEDAYWRGRFGDHPLLGLIDMSRRLVDKGVAKLDDLPIPDPEQLVGGLDAARKGLLAAGLSAAALAPLLAFRGKLAGMLEGLRGAPRPERRDYAYEELPDEDFSGLDLAGRSFACAELPRANFRDAKLAGADFTDAKLMGADFTGADLTGAKLEKARLARACLVGAKLDGAVLSGADVGEADLTGASMERAVCNDLVTLDTKMSGVRAAGADFTDAILEGIDLSGADLRGAQMEMVQACKGSFERADLTGANLRFATLTFSRLTEANLTEADLFKADLGMVRAERAVLERACIDVLFAQKAIFTAASLRGARGEMAYLAEADLTEADLRDVRFKQVNISKAILDRTDLTGATLDRVDMSEVVATKARFVKARGELLSAPKGAVFKDCQFALLDAPNSNWMEAELSGSDFSHANLTTANFQQTRGVDVSFFAASLKDAVFRAATLSRTRFVRADLCSAALVEATLKDVQFTGANLYDVKFMDATLEGCDFLEASRFKARFDRAVGAPR